MIYALIIWLVLLLGVSYVCSRQYLLSPSIITCGIWLVCLSVFVLLPHQLNPLKLQTLLCIGLWVTGMVVSSIVVQAAPIKADVADASKTMRDLYLLISIATFPLLVLWAYKAITMGDYGWSTNLRLAAIGSGLDKEVFGPLYSVVWQVSYALELMYFKKKHWWRLAVAGFLFLALGIATMSKTFLLSFCMFTICILFFKKKITFKHLLLAIIGIIAALTFMQIVRQNHSMTERGMSRFIQLYLLSSLPAFETVEPCSATHFGENTFRLIYLLLHRIGLSDIPPIDAILPFIKVPISTNTYTTMYPYFVDFGYAGIIIFSLLVGGLYGLLFQQAQRGNKYAWVIYAFTMHIILMQFAGDLLFTSMAGFLKMVIIALIPFAIEKSKVLYR